MVTMTAHETRELSKSEQDHDNHSGRLPRGQRGEDRRVELLALLRRAGAPILGTDIASKFGVSRQVLVQDIAVLRASGEDILATPRGYVLRSNDAQGHRTTLHVKHDAKAMADELTLLVDLGLKIVDVGIEHPVLGSIHAGLSIASRQDVQEILDRMSETGAAPLLSLTGGVHTHSVEAQRSDLIDLAREKLRERGYLVEK